MIIRNDIAAFCAASICFSMAMQPAHAGPAAEAAERAESLLDSGETLPAYNAFDTAQHAFWQASPLTFRKVVLVTRAGTFGDYDLRDDAVFKAGDTLMVYAEPVGFGIGTAGGEFQISLDTDLDGSVDWVIFNDDVGYWQTQGTSQPSWNGEQGVFRAAWPTRQQTPRRLLASSPACTGLPEIVPRRRSRVRYFSL